MAPYSPASPPRSRNSSPQGPLNSVVKGPAPTQEEYALTVATTRSMARAGRPAPTLANPGQGRRRGGIGVDAVVRVAQRAKLALQQDPLAVPQRRLQQGGRVHHHPAHLRAEGQQFLDQWFEPQRRRAVEVFQQNVDAWHGLAQALAQMVAVEQIPTWIPTLRYLSA